MNKFAVLTVVLLAGFSVSANAQSLDQMSPAQLLRALRSSISELNDTQSTLRNNAQAAEQNSQRVQELKEQGASLDDRAAAYDRNAVNHNRQASAYIDRCQDDKLPEDVYTQCLTLKQNLDIQKTRLDREAEQLTADHAAYNRKVNELNAEENKRVEAVGVLLKKYQRVEQAIRDLQVRLYELSVDDDRDGFSEQVRQCTKRPELDDMYSCMTSVWSQ